MVKFRLLSIAGILSLALGLIGLIGWHIHSEVLIQVFPSFAPIQYNTALGFFLCGLCMILLEKDHLRISSLFSVIVAAIGFFTILEYIFILDLGIDQLFMEHYIVVKTSHPGRMAPNTALSFMLSGSTLFLLAGSNNLKLGLKLSAIIVSIIIALSLLALFGYLSGLKTTYGWGLLTQMAVHTSIGFLFSGSGLGLFSWVKLNSFQNELSAGLVIPTFVGSMTIAVIMWQAIIAQVDVTFTLSLIILGAGLIQAILLSLLAYYVITSKINQESLKNSEEKYRDLYHNSPDMYVSVDAATGKILNCNNTFIHKIGYSKEEIIGCPIIDMYHPDSMDIAKNTFESFKKTGEVINVEMQLKQKNGKKIDAILNASSVKNEAGEILFSRSSWRDITDRKTVEVELEGSQSKLQTILDNVIDGIITTDIKGNIITVNKALGGIFGYKEKELLGKNVKILMPDPFYSQHDQHLTRYAETHKAKIIGIGREVVGKKKDGTIFPISLGVNEIILKGEKTYNGIIRDITESQTMRNNLEKIRNENDAFLSHELVNMITPAHTLSEFLLDFENENLSINQIEILGDIKSSLKKIIRFADNYKTIQNLEFGKTILDLKPTNINDVINKCISMEEKLAFENDVRIKFNSEVNGCMIDFDRTFIPGVFCNIIKNAIEHVSLEKEKVQKEIKIDITKEKNNVVIKVNNKGETVSEDKLKNFFGKFNVNKKVKKGGMGLGTTYAYLVTKAHQGNIYVDSNEKEGTTVKLEFKISDNGLSE